LQAVTPADLEAARRYARAYCRWRCGGASGRGKLDPIYVEETQGRDDRRWWDKYSSCGDLAQGYAYHMGVRKPYINRAEMPGGWISGRNLLHFYDGRQGVGIASPTAFPALHAYVKEHGPPAVKPAADYTPAAGDIAFVWTPGLDDAHTFVWGDPTPDGFESFDYGAGGMSRSEFPGAKCNVKQITQKGGGLWVTKGARTKKLQYVVPIARLCADSDGLPCMPGEVIEELERRTP
jgi:hypothetical protein